MLIVFSTSKDDYSIPYVGVASLMILHRSTFCGRFSENYFHSFSREFICNSSRLTSCVDSSKLFKIILLIYYFIQDDIKKLEIYEIIYYYKNKKN